MNIDSVFDDFEKNFVNNFKKIKKADPKPYESPIDEEKCLSCGMWERTECICED